MIPNTIFHRNAVSAFILMSSCFSMPLKYPAKVQIKKDDSIKDGFIVDIEAKRETWQLHLTPADSIWAEDAQIIEISTDDNGKTVFKNTTVPFTKIYKDDNVGAILSVNNGKLDGFLNSSYSIIFENGQHFLVKSDDVIEGSGPIDYTLMADDNNTGSFESFYSYYITENVVEPIDYIVLPYDMIMENSSEPIN